MQVSIGVNTILNNPAVIEAPIDLIGVARCLVDSKESAKEMNSVLEKVSPNLERGP